MLFAMIAAAGIFFADTYTPLGFAPGTLYIAPLLLISMLGNPRLLVVALVLVCLLTVGGYFLSPNGIDREIATANRAASIAAMVAFVAASVGAAGKTR